MTKIGTNTWGFSSSIVPQTALLNGRIPLGLGGIRVMGILWVVMAGAFVFAATGVARQEPWLPSATIMVALASLVMCILGLPEAKIGVAVNIVIIAATLLVLLLRDSSAPALT